MFENVRYGRIDATEAEVKQAIKLAHLEDFIAELPDSLDTLMGELGLKLSGGEKQRVAIARKILKRSPILAFDEATSSLDSWTGLPWILSTILGAFQFGYFYWLPVLAASAR